MTKPTRQRLPLWPSLYIFTGFCAFGLLLWAVTGHPFHMVSMPVIGLSIGVGMALHAMLRPRRRKWGRRLSLLLVGGGLFFGAGVFGRQSFQIEGVWFYLLHGVLGGVVVHYLVAKVVGPIFLGRAWCGWGCWTWLVLDFLPWGRPGRDHRRSPWRWMRLVHLLLSLALVLGLSFGLGYRHGTEWKATHGHYWFLAGNALYYLLAVGLAALLKDNRAFCKYACPVSVPLRLSSRLSLLRVASHREACTGCGACHRACPMGIDPMAWGQRGQRVLDPECTLCERCIEACPQRCLHLSLGWSPGPGLLQAADPPQRKVDPDGGSRSAT